MRTVKEIKDEIEQRLKNFNPEEDDGLEILDVPPELLSEVLRPTNLGPKR